MSYVDRKKERIKYQLINGKKKKAINRKKAAIEDEKKVDKERKSTYLPLFQEALCLE